MLSYTYQENIPLRSVEPSGLAELASLTACGLFGGTHTQLFWHRKELVSSVYDHLTLAQMRIHTGFSFEAYDLVRTCQLGLSRNNVTL